MKKRIHIALVLLSLAVRAAAQLSPGDPATPHAKLEGMSNCNPNQDCQTCHVTESWSASSGRFDHSKTKFQLLSAHLKQDCRACHFNADEPPKRQFTGLPAACSGCHDDTHAGQFMENGVTDCARCHNPDVWKIKKFKHEKTRFPLEGKHAKVACEQCHKPAEIDGVTAVRYKMASFECVDCHK